MDMNLHNVTKITLGKPNENQLNKETGGEKYFTRTLTFEAGVGTVSITLYSDNLINLTI